MDVSIIIPAYNNEKYVEIMLKTLSCQKCSCEWEILLIDDSESEVMLQFESLKIPNLRIIEKEHSGRAATRNVGIENSRGKYLVFMDSDMIVNEHFVEEHYKAHKYGKSDIVLGRVHHIPSAYLEEVHQFADGGNIDKLNDYVVDDNYLNMAEAVFVKNKVSACIGWTCCLFSNCSVKRSVFDKSGVFDLRFVGWGLEDIELGYRFYKAGFSFEFYKQIENFHVDHVTDRSKLIVEMGRNLKRLYEKHHDDVIRNYMSFVAGFKDLSTLYADVSGDEQGYAEGQDFYFKPLNYAKTKS